MTTDNETNTTGHTKPAIIDANTTFVKSHKVLTSSENVNPTIKQVNAAIIAYGIDQANIKLPPPLYRVLL